MRRNRRQEAAGDHTEWPEVKTAVNSFSRASTEKATRGHHLKQRCLPFRASRIRSIHAASFDHWAGDGGRLASCKEPPGRDSGQRHADDHKSEVGMDELAHVFLILASASGRRSACQPGGDGCRWPMTQVADDRGRVVRLRCSCVRAKRRFRGLGLTR